MSSLNIVLQHSTKKPNRMIDRTGREATQYLLLFVGDQPFTVTLNVSIHGSDYPILEYLQ